MSLLCLFCLPLSESLCVCSCVLMGNTSLSDRRNVTETDRQSRDEGVGFVVTCSSSRHFSAPSQCISGLKDFVILVYDSWFTGWNRWEGAYQHVQKTLHAHKCAHRKTPGYDSHHHFAIFRSSLDQRQKVHWDTLHLLLCTPLRIVLSTQMFKWWSVAATLCSIHNGKLEIPSC